MVSCAILIYSFIFYSDLQVTLGNPQLLQGSSFSREDEAVAFMQKYEIEGSLMCNLVMEATWNYQTNVTEFNRRIMLTRQLQGVNFKRKKWLEASRFNWKSFTKSPIRRLFYLITMPGSAALSDDERREYAKLVQEMKTDYSTARVCSYDPTYHRNSGRFQTNSKPIVPQRNRETNDENFGFIDNQLSTRYDDFYDDNDDMDNNCVPTLKLEPDLTRIMAESRNTKELRHAWKAWRNRAGRPQRRNFLRYVQMSNQIARLNGFNNTADYWQSNYEYPLLEQNLENIWAQVKPLYDQLHAYVRKKLRERYGDEEFSSDGTIPAHLLGNMWSQSWSNVLDLTIPYPGRRFVDVSQTMRQLGYNPTRIFRTAEDFFVSLGLEPLPRDFYVRSMLQKPLDREVICHASSWDFCNGRDYRIKQCTQITMNDLVTAHHEMGHVQYSMAYRSLPILFRDGANPGLHEAVGDAIGLSASTPLHLSKIGLLRTTVPNTYEDDINFLFSIALDKIAFLPFGYIVDLWRWKVFRGEVRTSELNDFWWQLRVGYQGVSPPGVRTERDFDPGAKYHIAANVPYIRYFIGYILQFQIHEELCRVAGHTGPLYKCDIYGSKAAGNRLRRMLRLGKSQSWHLALSELTDGRTRELDAKPMLRYFANLTEWLSRVNREENIGWYTSSAVSALRGYTINVSSSTFIGVMVFICALAIMIGCIGVYFYRKCKKHNLKGLPKIPKLEKHQDISRRVETIRRIPDASTETPNRSETNFSQPEPQPVRPPKTTRKPTTID